VTRKEIVAAGRRCLLCPGDLTDAAYCDALVERTVAELGGLDVLVSNAAYQRRKKRLEDVTDDDFSARSRPTSTRTSGSPARRCRT
jgi:NAD(P)-dependent dehydrogenase (short-subunit alcohol dehydrogenase family)